MDQTDPLVEDPLRIALNMRLLRRTIRRAIRTVAVERQLEYLDAQWDQRASTLPLDVELEPVIRT